MTIKLGARDCVYCKKCNQIIHDPQWVGKYENIEEVPCETCGVKEAAIGNVFKIANQNIDAAKAKQGALISTDNKSPRFTHSAETSSGKIKNCPQEFQQLLKIFKDENKGSTIKERW